MSTSPTLPASPRPSAPIHRSGRGRQSPAALAPETLPILPQYFEALFQAHGKQHWWPGRTPFEVIVGAILVQNTGWANVELAMANLRHAKLLTPSAMEKAPQPKLARLIRSSGYFRQKARKLKAYVAFLRKEHRGSLHAMFRTPTQSCESNSWESTASVLKPPIPSCSTQGITPSLLWMPIRGAFCNAMDSQPEKNRTRRFEGCSKRVYPTTPNSSTNF